MSGLEKILDDIQKEAENESQQILTEAQTKADAVLAEAEKAAKAVKTAAEEKAEKEAVLIRERSDSSSQLKRQQLLLAKKQELIHETIALAWKKLQELPDEQYFAVLLKLAGRNALPASGIMYLSDKDLKRMPSGFPQKLNALLAEKNAALEISGETRKLDGGFILQYGGIEENCSFEAMFSTEYDSLQDIAQKVLFKE